MKHMRILKSSRFWVLTTLVFVSAVYAEGEPSKDELIEFTKVLVEEANVAWSLENKKEEAAAKKREQRGEFSSVSPPKSLKPFKDWDYYYLHESVVGWFPNEGQEYEKVLVPPGFVTDMASIPKILWGFGLKPEGSYTYAAVIHDWLYWSQERTREEADKIFLYAMEDSKVEKGLRKKIYRAVRLAGGSAWKSNGKLKESGEKRILKKYPPDFTISWEEWKIEDDVFYK